MVQRQNTDYTGVHRRTRTSELWNISFNIPVMTGWTPRGDALTFLESRKGPQTLWNQPLDGSAPALLLDLHGERVFNFAWSRDGRLALSHGPAPTDVVLMTGIQ